MPHQYTIHASRNTESRLATCFGMFSSDMITEQWLNLQKCSWTIVLAAIKISRYEFPHVHRNDSHRTSALNNIHVLQVLNTVRFAVSNYLRSNTSSYLPQTTRT
eukprot:5775-Pleurochrysis_carterae.AAC.1